MADDQKPVTDDDIASAIQGYLADTEGHNAKAIFMSQVHALGFRRTDLLADESDEYLLSSVEYLRGLNGKDVLERLKSSGYHVPSDERVRDTGHIRGALDHGLAQSREMSSETITYGVFLAAMEELGALIDQRTGKVVTASELIFLWCNTNGGMPHPNSFERVGGPDWPLDLDTAAKVHLADKIYSVGWRAADEIHVVPAAERPKPVVLANWAEIRRAVPTVDEMPIGSTFWVPPSAVQMYQNGTDVNLYLDNRVVPISDPRPEQRVVKVRLDVDTVELEIHDPNHEFEYSNGLQKYQLPATDIQIFW